MAGMNDHMAGIVGYLNHLVMARTRHGVHSPFVYDLVSNVLRTDMDRPEHIPIEALREELLDSDRSILVNDLGAGSRTLDQRVRQVADMARTALKPPKQARLLDRLVRYFGPNTVVELGTSFGITTLYLASGMESGTVTTLEGCPQTYRIAQHHFGSLEASNIKAVLGSFRSALPEVLGRMERLDMAFIDGHHAKEPTLEYFDMLLAKAHNDTVFIFDDIHWSPSMDAAWEAIKDHPSVTVTIDLYHLGLVFVRSEQARQHFRLRY